MLEGLINLADAIADQAADHYGIDCLLPVSEGPETGDMEDQGRQETDRLIQQAEENGIEPERLDELVHEIASSHRWFADLGPVGGPVLGPFSSRTEALAAETSWLEAHWLVRAPAA